MVWPFFQTVNFWLMPLQYQMPFACTVAIFWYVVSKRHKAFLLLVFSPLLISIRNIFLSLKNASSMQESGSQEIELF